MQGRFELWRDQHAPKPLPKGAEVGAIIGSSSTKVDLTLFLLPEQFTLNSDHYNYIWING
jgi:hypothetical protein